MNTDNKITKLHLVVSNHVKPKTCGTCWHFNSELYYELDEEVVAGCGNDKMFVTRTDPVTHFAIRFRNVVASDAACGEHCLFEPANY